MAAMKGVKEFELALMTGPRWVALWADQLVGQKVRGWVVSLAVLKESLLVAQMGLLMVASMVD